MVRMLNLVEMFRYVGQQLKTPVSEQSYWIQQRCWELLQEVPSAADGKREKAEL